MTPKIEALILAARQARNDLSVAAAITSPTLNLFAPGMAGPDTGGL
jgi:hypothetical protein